MRITKKLLLLITIMFTSIFSSKEIYSKEKNSKPDYSYLTEKVSIYSDMNKKENIGYLTISSKKSSTSISRGMNCFFILKLFQKYDIIKSIKGNKKGVFLE